MNAIQRENASTIMALRNQASAVSVAEHQAVLVMTNTLLKEHRGNPELLKLKLGGLGIQHETKTQKLKNENKLLRKEVEHYKKLYEFECKERDNRINRNRDLVNSLFNFGE